METRALAIAFFYAVGHRARRHHRPAPLRHLIATRRSQHGDARLPDRRRRDGARRHRRALPRRQRRERPARGHREAVDRRGGRERRARRRGGGAASRRQERRSHAGTERGGAGARRRDRYRPRRPGTRGERSTRPGCSARRCTVAPAPPACSIARSRRSPPRSGCDRQPIGARRDRTRVRRRRWGPGRFWNALRRAVWPRAGSAASFPVGLRRR